MFVHQTVNMVLGIELIIYFLGIVNKKRDWIWNYNVNIYMMQGVVSKNMAKWKSVCLTLWHFFLPQITSFDFIWLDMRLNDMISLFWKLQIPLLYILSIFCLITNQMTECASPYIKASFNKLQNENNIYVVAHQLRKPQNRPLAKNIRVTLRSWNNCLFMTYEKAFWKHPCNTAYFP